MTTTPVTSPLTPVQLVDEYFIENRNRIIEVAAFLDRLDRADSAIGATDFRVRALRRALEVVLAGGQADRVREIQMLMSDPNTEPLPALDRKGAVGAYDPDARGGRP
jgi:hypothetical protein